MTSEIESVYKWLVKTYAYKYPSEPLNQLKADITKLQQQGKSRERAVLELSLQSGLRLLELDKLKKEAGSEEEAITEYLKNETLEFDEDSPETKDLVRKILEGQAFKSSDTLGHVRNQAGSRLPLPLKYFIHGFAFSLLFRILAIVWIVAFAVLVGVGFIIGWVIGIGSLFLMIGYLNGAIAKWLWFDVRQGFWQVLAHGIILFIILLLIDLVFRELPNFVFNAGARVPYPLVLIITFLVTTLLYGFVARKVASLWSDEVKG